MRIDVSKEKMNKINEMFKCVMLRYYVPEMFEYVAAKGFANLGVSLLLQENLEKRIQGVKMLGEVLEQRNM
jgi:hypothetical protein